MKKLKYIKAMSVPKQKIKLEMQSVSKRIEEHIAKCAMYGDSLGFGKYDHWIKEISNWISAINSMYTKPDNKKLKQKAYEDILFGGLGTDKADAKTNLKLLQLYNQGTADPYPEVEIDNSMVSRMYLLSQAIPHKFSYVLSTKNNFSLKEITEMLHEIMDPICK